MAGLRLGQLANEKQRFCPYAAVAKYPYRYFHQDSNAKKHVAEHFWDGGQFKDRGWNIYYIRTLLDTNPSPLLLIPKVEVENFFQDIEDETGIYLPFPDATTNPGFDIAFQAGGEPRPRYLGRLTSNITITDLLDLIPAEGMAPEEPLDLDDRSFPAFRKQMESAILAGKGDTQAQRDRKKKDRVLQKGRWCALLKRTQCYLGLRPHQAAQETSKLAAAAHVLPPLDLNSPVPYLFNLNVIFVSLDIEAYERDSKKITEIGISTLDTLDIIKSPPREDGTGWAKHMRCRHFRVADYAHLVNKRFVQGCPDEFRQAFGISEWISVNEIPKYIRHPTRKHDCPRYGSNIEPLVNSEKSPKRNVVLVGHEIRSDIAYLRSIGYNLGNLGNLLEAIDTIDLWRAWKHEKQAFKLSRILYELGVDAWHLHNAGNDAAYTMQALIGIALAALDPTRKAPISIPVDPSHEAALEESERRMEEEAEWADAEEAGGDGGEAVSISDAEFDISMAKERRTKERAAKGVPGSKHTRSTLPTHLRKLSKPTKGEALHQQPETAKDTKPRAEPSSVSQQMQKRLVIMDNEEYGMLFRRENDGQMMMMRDGNSFARRD